MANLWFTLTLCLIMVTAGRTQNVTEIVTEMVTDMKTERQTQDMVSQSVAMVTTKTPTIPATPTMKQTTTQKPTTPGVVLPQTTQRQTTQRQTTQRQPTAKATTVAPTTTLAPTTMKMTTPDPCPSECSCDKFTRTATCTSTSLSAETIPTFPSYITTLTLSGNTLSTLPADAFSGLTDLIRLYLVSCEIQTIEQGAFNGLNHLRILHLRYNKILSLDLDGSSVFSGLDELEELDLRNNNLGTLGTSGLSPLVNLKTLLLDDNQITTVDAGALANNALLTKVTMKNMQLTEIPKGVFSDTPMLKHLELSGNKVRTIPEQAFSDLVALEELVLQAMSLESLHNKAFTGLGNLKILDMLSNNLESMTKEVLEPLTSLLTLILSANPWNCNCDMFMLVDYLKATSIDFYRFTWTCVTPNRLNGERVYTIPESEFACVPVITSTSQTKTVDYGSQTYFECVANGDPTPVIEWQTPDGQTVTHTSNLANVYTGLMGTVVIIQHASKDENGLFRCIAKNDRGEASVDFSLIVQNIPTSAAPTTLAGPTTLPFTCPNALIDVRAIELKDTSVEMNWVQYNHPMTQGYVVEIAEFASQEAALRNELITPATNTSYKVEGLSPGTPYIICVSVYLPPCPTQTPYQQCEQLTTQGGADSVAALNKKHTNEIIGTALSVFFGTLLILASIFVILWQYRKPKEYTKYDFQVSKDTTRFADVEHGAEIEEDEEDDANVSKARYVARKPSARFNPNGQVNEGVILDDENSNTSTFKTEVQVHGGQNGIKPKSDYDTEETKFDSDGRDNTLTDIKEEEEKEDPTYDKVPEEEEEEFAEGPLDNEFQMSRLSTVGLMGTEF